MLIFSLQTLKRPLGRPNGLGTWTCSHAQALPLLTGLTAFARGFVPDRRVVHGINIHRMLFWGPAFLGCAEFVPFLSGACRRSRAHCRRRVVTVFSPCRSPLFQRSSFMNAVLFMVSFAEFKAYRIFKCSVHLILGIFVLRSGVRGRHPGADD